MQIQNQTIYAESKQIIESLFGPDADFRDGQYEAIEATMTRKRTLVVQKTGWGKSLVYFVCTKLLRSRGNGVTLVVSPLLVLMQNQMEAAEKMGLKCEVLNSTSKSRRKDILESIANGETDLVLVTPETLFSEDILAAFQKINIGLFVIDEAHCISDWGHDFRLAYSKLYRIINILPENVPLLATTATANDRVVEDLQHQLGENVFVSRGPLSRESLSIQVLDMPNRAIRFAWILQHINEMPDSGIIYCITQRDCEYVADFLNENGIPVLAYHSGLSEEEVLRAEDALHNNSVKAIVATIKLGMGYDKDDISFVIHFQSPTNIISYYQQIGRAGRKLDNAYAILMHGEEDSDIQNYFIETAFPTEEETNKILSLLEEESLSVLQLSSKLNIRMNRISKALTFLENAGCIFKYKSKYFISANKYYYDKDHYEAISSIRKKEFEQLLSLADTKECYMKYIVNALDDYSAVPCGHCANCLGRPLISEQIDDYYLTQAQYYLDNLAFDIVPRKRWPVSAYTTATEIPYINQVGICLSRYADAGYGKLVQQGKYKTKVFADELVGKSAEILKPFVKDLEIEYITCVPSLRSDIVPDFTKRLADSLGIKFINTLGKRPAEQQKEMENSAHQCLNALRSFYVLDNVEIPDKILLVDDMVDSGWTLAVCGNLLGEHRCHTVLPYVLADTSNND
ncbi:MAG: RecQ family ATP-dependent DNA helicase [Clostridiales bacterium]|nr:RecQ family ATP-dependent DNA helicase [Clostridiales bacterium]